MMMGGCLCPMLFCKSGLYTKAACVSSAGMGVLGEHEVSLVPNKDPASFALHTVHSQRQNCRQTVQELWERPRLSVADSAVSSLCKLSSQGLRGFGWSHALLHFFRPSFRLRRHFRVHVTLLLCSVHALSETGANSFFLFAML